ncbi:glycoside hydrolase family 30 protein [Bifidobacterium sp.]|uniref:glycoside hydrolase family 30 protein n=1 Tax=Bifidobacterium sp. TaxID=41200 RepID=UPI0039E7AD92
MAESVGAKGPSAQVSVVTLGKGGIDMAFTIMQSTDAHHLWQPVEEDPVSSDVTLAIDHCERHQSIDGFGASFTDSSAYLMSRLPEEQREQAMRRLFSPKDGIGLSMLRNPMGACDYSREFYTYDDMPQGRTDVSLRHFSIAHDEEAVIPLTALAMRLNPELKLMASPWSAPAWMKSSRRLATGRLLPRFYESYAQYFVRFIEAYRGNGIPVFAVTPQNEPLFEPRHYPSMRFSARGEARFVQRHLRPAFDGAGLRTRILGYDHNWDRPSYPLRLLKKADEAFDGIAWHWYGGEPQSQTVLAKRYPDKAVYFTEGSGGSWIPEFHPAFSNLMRRGIEILKNGSRCFILWNIALDEHNGPVVPGFGESTCRGLLRIGDGTSRVEYTLDYYGLAHFSAFIRPGAIRIGGKTDVPLCQLVCENPDGSTVVVMFNDSATPHHVSIVDEDLHGTVSCPAHSAVTVVLNK